jgi:hypothetical protein
MASVATGSWSESEESAVKAIDWLFVIAVLLGIAAILGSELKYGPRWGAEAFLSALIVGYATVSYGFSRARYRRHWDKLGDNCYYLGFLFTLATLALALYRFSGQVGVIEELVRDFGIALWTTIVGMLLRIIIYQLESSPETEPDEALRLLGNQALETGDKLRLTGSVLEAANRKLIGVVRSAADDTVQTLKGSAERIRQAGEATSTALQQKLEGMESLNERVNNAAGSLSDSISEMGRRIAQVDVPPDLVAKKLAPVIRSLASGLTQIDNGAKRAEEGNERLLAVLAALDRTAGGAAHTIDRLLGMGKELEPFVTLVRRICEELDGAAIGLAKSSKTVLSAADGAADMMSELAKRAAADSEVVAKHREALDGELERMRVAITSAEAPLLALSDALRARIEDEAKNAADYRELLEKQLKGVEEIHQKLQTNAVSIIDFIAGRIGNGRT